MPKRLPIYAQTLLSEAKASRDSIRSRCGPKAYAEARKGRKTLTCARGCNHCCHYPIHITLAEAFELRAALVRARKWTLDLKGQLQEHSDAVLGLPLETWLLMERPCPLLKGGDCSVYANRPLVCQATYAMSDPHYCHPARIGKDTHFTDKTEELAEADSMDAKVLRALKVPHLKLSISTALLMVDRVVNGGLAIEELGRLMYEVI